VNPETDRTWRLGVLVAVFVGGCAGGLARHVVVSAWPDSGFPWTVLAVNCSGAFALGLLIPLVRDSLLRALLGTGLLGAWTTFSAIVVSATELIGPRPATAAAYLVASAVGGVLAVVLGLALGRRVASS